MSFQTPNWLEGVATFYASALLGAVVVPIVHIYGRHELEYILRQSRPRVHVTATGFGHQDYLANLESIGDLPMDIVVIDGDGRAGTTRFGDLPASDPFGPPAHTDPGAPALDRVDLRHHRQPQGGDPLPPDGGSRDPRRGGTTPSLPVPLPDGQPDQPRHRHAGGPADARSTGASRST